MVILTTSECVDIATHSIATIKSIVSQLSYQEETAQTTEDESDVDPGGARNSKFLSDLGGQLDRAQKWVDDLAGRASQSVPRSALLYLLDTLEQLCVDRYQILQKHHDEGYLYSYSRLKALTVADDSVLKRLVQEDSLDAQSRLEDFLRELAKDKSAYRTPTGGITIASLAADCLKYFENASKVAVGIYQEELRVQLTRFNIWASNIGVFVRGGLSLDKRLEVAPDIAELFNELLEMLQLFIEQAFSSPRPIQVVVSNEAPSPTLEENIPKTMEDERNIQGTPQYLHDIAGLITRLHRLSVAVRAASGRNPYSRIFNFTIVDEHGENIDSAFKSFVQQFLQSRYSNLPSNITDRLASAIYFRRRRFQYHMARAQKLAQRPYHEARLEIRRPHETKLNVHIPSSPLITESNVSHNSTSLEPISTAKQSLGSPSTVPSGFDRSKLRLPTSGSQTQPSIAPSENAVIQRSTEIPLPPVVPRGLPEYPCPYCRKVCAARTFLGTRWKAHFERDLEPYSCLFLDCSEPDALFATSNDWLSHTMTHYNQEWTCRICRKEVFSNKQDVRQHLASAHSQLAKSQIQTLLQHGIRRREPPGALFYKCLFCNHSSSVDSMSDEQSAKKHSDMNDHIANHLLSLSMISLPLEWQEKSSNASAQGSVQLSEASSSVTSPSAKSLSSLELERRLLLPENEVESKQLVGAWIKGQEVAEPTDTVPNLSMSDSAIIDPESTEQYSFIENESSSEIITSLPTLPSDKLFPSSDFKLTSLSVSKPEVEWYRYKSLSRFPEEKEFRLLHIMPAYHTADPLCASISHVLMDNHPEYIALTYCWDYSEKEEPIIMVDGVAMRVRHNLLRALCVLRDPVSEVTIWVDALCINMYDMEERRYQLSFMSKIFIQAFGVWIWLGVEEGTSAALRGIQALVETWQTTLAGTEELSGERPAVVSSRSFLHKFLKRVKRSTESQLEILQEAMRQNSILTSDTNRMISEAKALDRSTTGRASDPSDHSKQLREEQSEVAISRPIDFVPVLRNSIFNRRWVIQEVVVAQSVIVFSQGDALAWTEFESAVENLTQSDKQVLKTEAWQFIQVIRAWQGRADSSRVEQPASFETIVALATTFSNTDPRDTIYALLSLIRSDEPPWQGIIDYDKVFVEVAVDYVRYTISSSDSLNIICRPWIQDWSRGEWPSWICTIKSDVERSDLGNGFPNYIADTFVGMPGRCNFAVTAGLKPRVRFDQLCLIARGFIFGHIMKVTLPHSLPSNEDMLGRRNSRLGQTPAPVDFLGDYSRDQIKLDKYSELFQVLDHYDKSFTMEKLSRCVSRQLCIYVLEDRHDVGFFGFALSASHPRAGDRVCLLLGCDVPVILRPVSEKKYTLIGEAYVSGIMFGEALKPTGTEEFLQDISII